MGIVGKSFKNKINGNIFFVKESFIEGNEEYYIVGDVGVQGGVCVSKEIFEKIYMPYLETI